MESHLLRACQLPLQRRHFRRRQLLQPGNGGLPAKALFRQQPIEAEVAGLTGYQLSIQPPKLRIRAVLGQQGHALMAAGLD